MIKYSLRLLLVLSLVAVLLIAGCSRPATTTQPPTTNSVKVKVVIYSDPQCHACYRLTTEVEPGLVARYGNNPQVSIETKYAPFMGQLSSTTSQAILCAGDQGKYSVFRDAILAAWDLQGAAAYSQSALDAAAGSLGLNLATFDSCIVTGKYRQTVSDNLIAAGQLNIDQYPTIFVNDVRIIGVQPLDVFTSAIDAALAK